MLLVLVVHCPFGRVLQDRLLRGVRVRLGPPAPATPLDRGFVVDVQTFIDCPGTPRQCLMPLSSKVHNRHHPSTMLDDDKCLLGGSSCLRNTDLRRAPSCVRRVLWGPASICQFFLPTCDVPWPRGVCRRRPFHAE